MFISLHFHWHSFVVLYFSNPQSYFWCTLKFDVMSSKEQDLGCSEWRRILILAFYYTIFSLC